MTTSRRTIPDAAHARIGPDLLSKRRQRSSRIELVEDVPAGPTYRVSAYTVYPSGYESVSDSAKKKWCLSVADAGDGWAIRRGNMCLNIALQWEVERSTRISDAQFMRRCRYNEHAAILRARRVVDKLEVEGLTFDEFVNQLGPKRG